MRATSRLAAAPERGSDSIRSRIVLVAYTLAFDTNENFRGIS